MATDDSKAPNHCLSFTCLPNSNERAHERDSNSPLEPQRRVFLITIFTILQMGICVSSRYLHDRSGVRRNTRPELCALLGNGSTDGTSLHLSLIVHDNSGAVLEVDEDALLSAEGLALPDDDGGHDLLTELGLSLLHRAHDHVSGTGLGQAVEAAANVAHGDDVQVLGA